MTLFDVNVNVHLFTAVFTPYLKRKGTNMFVALSRPNLSSVFKDSCGYVTRTGAGDVAQLVERRTGTPLTQVRFIGAARDFSFSQLPVQTLSVYSRVRSHALSVSSVRTLKIL